MCRFCVKFQIVGLATHCAGFAQRGGGFTQAGASVRLGREQKMMLPALCHTRMHPRLRETARCTLAFFLFYLQIPQFFENYQSVKYNYCCRPYSANPNKIVAKINKENKGKNGD